MDKHMGKIGWSDAIVHDNTALDELFVQLPYNVCGGERVRAVGAPGGQEHALGAWGWPDVVEVAQGHMEVAWDWQVGRGEPEVHRWGAGTWMGPGARHVRGVKGSQTRCVAG